jgi:hypothetical protein
LQLLLDVLLEAELAVSFGLFSRLILLLEVLEE